MRTVITVLCFLTLVSVSRALNDPVVQTPLGAVRGKQLRTEAGREYAAFEGIPYAKPPIQKYRFREPRPIRTYHGEIQARFQHICLQYNHYTRSVIGEEDCLYLNVYSPQLNVTTPLPVVIFIHGGAFMFGSGFTYGHRYLMDRDVVYVSFNYRLGPLGFLSTEDAVVPGNNGMKDQVLALRWIRNNIQYFGGDPGRITLTGMSAGGASVHLHYLSPLSTGLFNQGFSLSGTALNPWVLQENSREKALKLAALMECATNDTRLMINCLSFIPARNIVEAVPQFLGYMYNPFSPFGLVVEPTGTQNAFLPSHPYELLKQGKIQDLPWITSVVQSEGLYPGAEFWPDPKTLPEIDSRWKELAAHLLDFNYTLDSNQHAEISSKIKDNYLKKNSISKSTFSELIHMISDRLFVTDAQISAKLQASIVTSPVHFYYFTYRGAHSKSETLSKSSENFGAAHGDDTVYVLSSDVNVTTTENDKKMQKVLLDFWMSYANDGYVFNFNEFTKRDCVQNTLVYDCEIDKNVKSGLSQLRCFGHVEKCRIVGKIHTYVPKLLNTTWDTVSVNVNDPLHFLEIECPETVIKQTQDFKNVPFWLSLPFKENHNLYPNTKDEF